MDDNEEVIALFGISEVNTDINDRQRCTNHMPMFSFPRVHLLKPSSESSQK